MGDSFSGYHPLVNFIYYGLIFAFSMFFMHPICLLISLMGSFTYSVELGGRKQVWTNLKLLLPSMLAMGLMNPAFNHEGATILGYLKSGNPLTLESIIYGLAAASMLASVVMWFSTYNQVMTSDKFIYLFGRIIPSLSLVLSMALRFVPRFKEQIRLVSNAQKCIVRDISNGSLYWRMKNAITIFSIMISWSLENAIETSDSMKSRGYGLEGRTSFSIYRFEARDRLALIYILGLGLLVIACGWALGAFKWRYFPNMQGSSLNFTAFLAWGAYSILAVLPIILNRQEERQWQSTQSRI